MIPKTAAQVFDWRGVDYFACGRGCIRALRNRFQRQWEATLPPHYGEP